MKGITFGDYHSFNDLHLILKSKEIGSPSVKTMKIDVEGADGALDLTDFFGEPKYEDVKHKFEFSTVVPKAEFLSLFSTVKNALHGKKMRIILDDDPLFYYLGRLSVSGFTNNKSIGSVSIEAECEPYKYKLAKTVVTRAVNGTESIALVNSRGRTATTTKSITVIAYTAPKITSFQGFRCLADGTENYEGTYINAAVKFSISAVGDKNTKTYAIEYKKTSATAWTALASGSVYSLNQSIISASGLFSVDSSYDIRLSVTDYFGTVRSTFEIPTAFTLLDFNSSGKGLAFGKVSELTEGVEFALLMKSGHGELVNSPVPLPSNQDLNNLKNPGFYIIGSTVTSTTILNKPPMTASATALIEVIQMGDGVQLMQRFSLCDKDDELVWQRIFYGTAWGSWMLIGGCSEWKNLTLNDGFSLYGGISGNQPKYRINGNNVTVKGVVSPKTAYTSSITKVPCASGIPEDFRPELALSFVCQGSGMNRWVCGIETNGTVTVSRYGITEGVNVPTNAWLVFCCTYSI